MPSLQIVELLPGFQTFSDDNVNNTYHGSVAAECGGIFSAYFKSVPVQEVFIECLCSLIAQDLELPTPEPLLIIPAEDACPEEHHPEIPLFGSIDDGHPSLRKRIKQGYDTDELNKRLLRWRYLPRASVFDEQMLNGDRHAGNLLYTGINEFELIDHGLAFSGESDQPCSENKLLELINNSDTVSKRRAVKSIRGKDLCAIGKIDAAALVKKTLFEAYNVPKAFTDHLMQVYQERLNFLEYFVLERLGLPTEPSLFP